MSDEIETIDKNPKSWAAWKREAERLQGIIDGMALDAMDSEPVAWDYEWASCITCEGPQDFKRIIEREAPPEWAIEEGQARNIIPLYRHAQPAPVVMDDEKLRALFDAWFASDCSFDQSPEASEADNIAWRESYWYVWQRCRAAMFQAGNSPVIPDGYVMVPKVPTAEMISSGIAAHYDRSQIQIHDRPAPGPMECAYVAMLAAAPQEVKP